MRERWRAGREGFTLLELGVLMGVAAILAAAIVPDLVEGMRNRAAEKAARDVMLLHDAARLFYIQDRSNGFSNRWPGETTPGSCMQGFSEGQGQYLLMQGSYVMTPANAFLSNPWGRPYDITTYLPNAANWNFGAACLFGVVTDVPTSVSNAFISSLPMASCSPGVCPPATAAVPANFSHCCSFIFKPGAQMQAACGVGAHPSYKVYDCSGTMRCCSDSSCATCQ